MMFQNCPSYLDQEGALRCGLPAEVRCRFTMRSADGPLESAMIRCPGRALLQRAHQIPTSESTGDHDPGTTRLGSLPGVPASRAVVMAAAFAMIGAAMPAFAAAVQRSWRRAWVSGTVVLALVILVTAGSYGAGNDNLSDLLLFAAGVAVLPAWLIWTGRVSGTGDAFPDPR